MKILYSAKGPEFIIELASIASHVISSLGGLPEEKAEELATEIADQVAGQHGGFSIYIPRGNWNGSALRWHELAERDRLIVREYDGTNLNELCHRHGISRSRVYQIIREVRRRDAVSRRNGYPVVPSSE